MHTKHRPHPVRWCTVRAGPSPDAHRYCLLLMAWRLTRVNHLTQVKHGHGTVHLAAKPGPVLPRYWPGRKSQSCGHAMRRRACLCCGPSRPLCTWPMRASFRGLMRRLASSSFGADRLLRLHRRRGSVRGLAA